MVILQSCCCWRSVRKGSYASATHTAIYFSVMTIIFVHHFEDPQEQSILEPEGVTQITNLFIIILLSCSICGIAASILLIYGLYWNKKILLIPWILTVSVFTLADLVYCTYVFVGGVYALLCVISQYQEYKAGRGTAEDDQHNNRLPSVHYSAPTTTTYLSTRRACTATYPETRPTPTQSPTGAHTSLATDEPSPNPNKPPRKHVQFPDHDDAANISASTNEIAPNGSGSSTEPPWTIDMKSLVFRGFDTTPLIQTYSTRPTQLPLQQPQV